MAHFLSHRNVATMTVMPRSKKWLLDHVHTHSALEGFANGGRRIFRKRRLATAHRQVQCWGNRVLRHGHDSRDSRVLTILYSRPVQLRSLLRDRAPWNTMMQLTSGAREEKQVQFMCDCPQHWRVIARAAQSTGAEKPAAPPRAGGH